jgi:hypothetical protein
MVSNSNTMGDGARFVELQGKTKLQVFRFRVYTRLDLAEDPATHGWSDSMLTLLVAAPPAVVGEYVDRDNWSGGTMVTAVRSPAEFYAGHP